MSRHSQCKHCLCARYSKRSFIEKIPSGRYHCSFLCIILQGFISPLIPAIMSKEKVLKEKSNKKAPEKSLKEKRAAKAAKKDGKSKD